MSRRNPTTPHQRGNPIANNPLMRKGGVHKKSRSSKRQKYKRETRRLVANYMGTARGRSRGGGGRYFPIRSKPKRHEAKNFMPFFIFEKAGYFIDAQKEHFPESCPAMRLFFAFKGVKASAFQSLR